MRMEAVSNPTLDERNQQNHSMIEYGCETKTLRQTVVGPLLLFPPQTPRKRVLTFAFASISVNSRPDNDVGLEFSDQEQVEAALIASC
jgi:hypothetical protein